MKIEMSDQRNNVKYIYSNIVTKKGRCLFETNERISNIVEFQEQICR